MMLKKKRDDTTVAEIGVDMEQVVETLSLAFFITHGVTLFL